jgi:ribosomal protein S21
MATNVEVGKKKNENAVSLLRRFSRKVKQSSILQAVRGKRYYQREESQLRKKRGAMARIEGAKKFEKLYKLGRIQMDDRFGGPKK